MVISTALQPVMVTHGDPAVVIIFKVTVVFPGTVAGDQPAVPMFVCPAGEEVLKHGVGGCAMALPTRRPRPITLRR